MTIAGQEWALQSQMPEGLAGKVLEIGRVIDVPKMAALYAPMQQHSHMSEVYAINTADTRLTDEILKFVKAGK